MPLYLKQNIAGCLSAAEASSLMLVSGDMHLAIHADARLRLDELSRAFDRLGCNTPLMGIQPTQQVETGTVAALPADAAAQECGPVTQRFKLMRSLAAKARHPGEKSPAAQARCAGSLQDSPQDLASRRQALESEIEEVMFDHASQRMQRSRRTTAPDESEEPEGPAEAAVQAGKERRRLHNAIDRGDVELVRAGLREFLSLPARLIPRPRMVAWLREPMGKCTLEFFGQYCCGQLDAKERQYEAITAYVDEIVSSAYLTAAEKSRLCVTLERTRLDLATGVMKRTELDIVQHAMNADNPAVATSVLLGIHESSAEPELKRFLLGAIGARWGSLANCVDSVNASWEPYRSRAPDWVEWQRARLRRLKLANAAPPAETRV